MMPMDGEALLGIYEDIAELTDRMLAAARVGDWDRLSELETLCARHVDQIRAEEPLPPLSGENRERKVALLRKLLEDDRAIRAITQPWCARLDEIVGAAADKPLPAGLRRGESAG